MGTKKQKPSSSFKTAAMKRIALDLPLTPLEQKLYGSKSNRTEHYRNQLGSVIFPSVISEIQNEEAIRSSKRPSKKPIKK